MKTITLAAKLLVLASEDTKIGLLVRYVFSLARYDSSFDVRDRARMLSSLLSGVSPSLHLQNGDLGTSEEGDVLGQGGVVLRKEQVRVVLFEGKLNVQEKAIGSGTSSS